MPIKEISETKTDSLAGNESSKATKFQQLFEAVTETQLFK